MRFLENFVSRVAGETKRDYTNRYFDELEALEERFPETGFVKPFADGMLFVVLEYGIDGWQDKPIAYLSKRDLL
jgi:hypothetical protein